jgi:methyl-accepting chemotaxis protein
MKLSDLSISRKLSAAFAILILAQLASAAVVLSSIGHINVAAGDSASSLTLAARSQLLLTDILEQTNALRGYVIKGDPKFAATYRESKAAFDKTLDETEASTVFPEEKALCDQLRVAMAQWRANIGDKAIGLMAQPTGQAEAGALSGVKSLTRLRALQKDLHASAERHAALAREARGAASTRAVASLLVGGISAVVIAGLMGFILGRMIARPIGRLTEVMGDLARGNNRIEVPALGRNDELGRMASAVQSFKEAAIAKLELEADADAQRAAAEVARRDNERSQAAIAREQAQVVERLGEGLSHLSSGDLTYRLDQDFEPAYRRLQADFNAALATLQDTISVIGDSTSAISGGSGEITRASDDLSRRIEQQAASLEQTAAALHQITTAVRSTAEGAVHARDVVAAAKADAEHSGEVVGQTVAAMDRIEQSSREIGQIIGLIDEIAFQTNLLALNAGVEAARAGDAGKGFAVVAQEVRALAQRAAEAAKGIKALISVSTDQVKTGVDLVGETGRALERIVGRIGEINAVVLDISASAQEQAQGLQEVNIAVDQMDRVTQQNAAMVEEATAASHALAREAETLSRLMGQFQVEAKAGPTARPRRVAA